MHKKKENQRHPKILNKIHTSLFISFWLIFCLAILWKVTGLRIFFLSFFLLFITWWCVCAGYSFTVNYVVIKHSKRLELEPVISLIMSILMIVLPLWLIIHRLNR